MSEMSRAKGTPKTGGRVAGTPNQLTTEVRQMIMNAMKRAGGEDYLLRQSEQHPVAFMTLFGKLAPTTVAGDPENPLIPAPVTTEELQERARKLIADAFGKAEDGTYPEYTPSRRNGGG
jgi:hypothetical protein